MQIIKSIEDSFDALPSRTKFNLYVLPLLLIVFIFFIINDTKKSNNLAYKNQIVLNRITLKKSMVDILKEIELYAQKNLLDIKSIKSLDNSIEIVINATLKKRLIFINFIEGLNNFSKVESLEIFGDTIFMEIGFNKFYNKDLEKFNFSKIENSLKSKDLRLNAIIEDMVLINKSWLKIGDNIDGFLIEKVDKNRVFLVKKYETKILKLRTDESL